MHGYRKIFIAESALRAGVLRMGTTGLFCALDFADEESAWEFYRKIRSSHDHFKVGLELFSAAGPDFVRRLTDDGAKVFLDLKLHDIPNTVAKAVGSISRLGVSWATIHILGGEEMVRAARSAADAAAGASVKILGVTVLTSMNEASLRSVNIAKGTQDQVLDLAMKGKEWGLDGVICSPQELRVLRAELAPPFLTVVPGIRMEPLRAGDDQARVAAPEDAARDGASFIVVGRPILQAKDPVATVHAILQKLGGKP